MSHSPIPRENPLEASRYLEALWGAIRTGFLEEIGWQENRRLLTPPRDHPLLGQRTCANEGCSSGVRSPHGGLCQTCSSRHRASGLSIENFMKDAASTKHLNRGERLCVVPECPRPSGSQDNLCQTHNTARRLHADTSLETWLRTHKPRPLPPLGPCQVKACLREAAEYTRLCPPHSTRWRKHKKQADVAHNDKATLATWSATQEPIGGDCVVPLTGLPDEFIAELLLALQVRCDEGSRTPLTWLRSIIRSARETGVHSLVELADIDIPSPRKDISALIKHLGRACRIAMASPDSEFDRDVWDLEIFGTRGVLDFTVLTQTWLRKTAKHWAAEDLPLHRGKQSGASAKGMVDGLSYLSESLRVCGDDEGDDPSALSRRDIVFFTNRLKHFEHVGRISAKTRLRILRAARRGLDDYRSYGEMNMSDAFAPLPHSFTLFRSDVPQEPSKEKIGRALPSEVVRIIWDNLDVFEARSGSHVRVITELLIETGRRPAEICSLPYDCLLKELDDKYVLVYDNAKSNRPGRRLPITDSTASRIRDQKRRMRALHPEIPLDQLPLFPRERRNQSGLHAISNDTFSDSHRNFVDLISHLLKNADGSAFPARNVVPYSYRHSYAQRHADAGIPPDVLRDLLDHQYIDTTMGYYNVSEKRVRSAVDEVARHQFDGQGNPVLVSVGKLLDHEHARLRVGQVAVPFGVCTEPSNVKADGQACPFKYTCVGCGHFRSDPSYLPELRSYLQQLLGDREHVIAATDLQDWAKEKVMPAEEEITQLRELIRRIEADLVELSSTDRAVIEQAVSVVRSVRTTVDLGMPSSRPSPRTFAGSPARREP